MAYSIKFLPLVSVKLSVLTHPIAWSVNHATQSMAYEIRVAILELLIFLVLVRRAGVVERGAVVGFVSDGLLSSGVGSGLDGALSIGCADSLGTGD